MLSSRISAPRAFTLAFVLIGGLSLGLVGCGKATTPSSAGNGSTSITSTPTTGQTATPISTAELTSAIEEAQGIMSATSDVQQAATTDNSSLENQPLP